MFARVHTLETTAEQSERGREIIETEYLPWARESTGFRGLIRLADATTGKTLVVTLWADKDTLDASAAAARKLGAQIADASGATYRSIEDFEVALFELA